MYLAKGMTIDNDHPHNCHIYMWPASDEVERYRDNWTRWIHHLFHRLHLRGQKKSPRISVEIGDMGEYGISDESLEQVDVMTRISHSFKLRHYVKPFLSCIIRISTVYQTQPPIS